MKRRSNIVVAAVLVVVGVLLWTVVKDRTAARHSPCQRTFVPQVAGSCTAPYVTAGGYCVLPADTGATLTLSGGTYKYTAAPGEDTYSFNSSGQLTADRPGSASSMLMPDIVTFPEFVTR